MTKESKEYIDANKFKLILTAGNVGTIIVCTAFVVSTFFAQKSAFESLEKSVNDLAINGWTITHETLKDSRWAVLNPSHDLPCTRQIVDDLKKN